MIHHYFRDKRATVSLMPWEVWWAWYPVKIDGRSIIGRTIWRGGWRINGRARWRYALTKPDQNPPYPKLDVIFGEEIDEKQPTILPR